MRIILFQNDLPLGIFTRATSEVDCKALVFQLSMSNIAHRYHVIRAPVIRADGSKVQDLTAAADLAASIPAAELRDQLLSCYEDWLEVCYAVTGENRHFNPDEILAKIRELHR